MDKIHHLDHDLVQIIHQNKITQVFEEMLNNLEEAIVVCQEKKINFMNHKFKNLIKRLQDNTQISSEEILNLEFLKVFRKTDEPDHVGSQAFQ